MGEAKHTPGPWSIEGRRGPGYIISAGINAERDGPETYVGVLDPMFHVAGEPSDLAANARLIAAAPDLLEALKALLEHEGIAAAAPEDVDGEDRALESQARAAIAKAEARA